MTEVDCRPVVVIVGGGLVGTLNAIFFAKTKKFNVILFEKRNDIRNDVKITGRSINLALSYRARCALKEADLEYIINDALPMFGRMIHGKNGSLRMIPYTADNQSTFAVNRRYLNEVLLTNAEKYTNVAVKFEHDLIDVDLNEKVTTFLNKEKKIKVKFDFLIGNDGSNSYVRQEMMKFMRLDFSQEYIPHGYMEIYFPAAGHNEFSMHKNCLHIWPRNEFMLIALPNPDGSFTGTLFMPFNIFETLKIEEHILNFFKNNFPDALKLIGESRIVETFLSIKPSSMVTIKCSPYNYEDSCLLMGDSAHAMVPFYGQGLNAGFEDVIIFHEILRQNEFDLAGCCTEFSKTRCNDAKAICELALFNYEEMRKTVNSRSFLIRKHFDNLMNKLFPLFWIPLYTMVTFSRMPYTKCMQERKKQDKILTFMGYSFMLLITSGLCLGIKNLYENFHKLF